MLAVLAALAVAFPQEPIAEQVRVGVSIATKEPKLRLEDLFRSPEPRSSMDRIWGNEKQAIGLWSNGYVKTPVEHVVWVSPELVSRWLGFLSAREHWEDGELEARWQRVAAALGQRKAFIVQLSAYPKMPTYGVGEYERTTPDEIEDVRFVYTSGNRSATMQAQLLAQWQSRDRRDLEAFPWWQYVSFGQPMVGEFERNAPGPPLPLGDYHRAWYLVWIMDDSAEPFEVRTLSRRKERVAAFKPSKKS